MHIDAEVSSHDDSIPNITGTFLTYMLVNCYVVNMLNIKMPGFAPAAIFI